MGIGSKLQALLDAANIRPATMAADLGISKNTIYGIIKRDNRKVEIDTLLEIANYLNVPLDFFLKDTISAPSLSPEAIKLGYRYDKFDERGKQLMLALANAIEKTKPADTVPAPRPYVRANAQPGATMPALDEIDEELSAAYHGHGEHDIGALNEEVNDDPT